MALPVKLILAQGTLSVYCLSKRASQSSEIRSFSELFRKSQVSGVYAVLQ
jgi:hypothetical protein